MALESAGLLMCRWKEGGLQYFLVHPGGPFYTKKEEGYWGIPKGLVDNNESLEAAAEREFVEETGIKPVAPYHPLGSVKLKSGKIVYAWAFLGEWDDATPITSNRTTISWPPNSGKTISIPENDKGEWMSLDKAKKMITPAQSEFLTRAIEILG